MFLYHRQSSDIESNEVWETVSKTPYTEGHNDSKKSSKTLQAESEELYYKYVYTHTEFVLMTGASSAEESTDIVQTCMIVQTYIGITQKE